MQRIQIIGIVCACAFMAVSAPKAQPADSLLTALLGSTVSVAESEIALARTRAAHLTVLTAEDLEAFGFATLAEAVQQLAGVYVANDHAYVYLGVRGLGLTSDYNSRLIVAIDGVSTKEFAFGSSLTERGLGIPMSAIERIEVVRGPGTLDYGSGSMVMVIHIITRSASRMPVLGAHLHVNASRALEGTVTYSRKTAKDDLVVMGGGTRAPGLTYRFIHNEVGPYTSSHDREDAYGFFARYQRRGTRISVLHSRRDKDVPSAPYETLTTLPTVQSDQTTQLRLRHSRHVRESLNFSADASAQWYDFSGAYPYPDEFGRAYWAKDFSKASRYTVSVDASHASPAGNSWTLRSSVVRHPEISYNSSGHVSGEENERLSMSVASTAALGEWRLWPRLMARAGAQVEWNSYANSTRFAPEAGVIYAIDTKTTLRFLYAHTYRLPSFYETLQAEPRSQLVAESGNALEFTLSAEVSQGLTLDAGAYFSRFNNLIRARLNDSSMDAYENSTDVDLRGVEVSLHKRWGGTSYGYANYAFSAPRVLRGDPLPNSPRHLARVGGWSRWSRWLLSTQWRVEGPRSTLHETNTPTYVLGDLKASVNVHPLMNVYLSVRNVLDTPYAHPGGHDHLMNTIPQPGRVAGVGMTWQLR